MNIFKDESGRTVIGQKPNLPIIVWATSELLTFLPLPTYVIEVCSLVAFGSLFTWAWLEIFDGVNLFRRMLGVLVLILLLISSL